MEKTRGKLTTIKLENYQPLRELVFEKLREAIISGALPEGERLMEVQLAEELGVSRTPIREAIRRLELEGFVVMMPRKGAYVSGFTLKDIINVFEIREALDELACSLAAVRISDDQLEYLERLMVELTEATENENSEEWIRVDTLFHDAIYKACNNDRLMQMIGNIMEQIQRYRQMSLNDKGRMPQALEEHRALVNALWDRDAKEAQLRASMHINNAEARIIALMRKNAEEDNPETGQNIEE